MKVRHRIWWLSLSLALLALEGCRDARRTPVVGNTTEPRHVPREQTLVEPTVPRFTPVTEQAIEAAAAYTGKTGNSGGDAWQETACNGFVVHIYDPSSREWLWYDLTTSKVTQHVSAHNVLSATTQQVDIEESTWLDRQDQPGGRPRYLVGFVRQTGEFVWLHFSTEKCSLLPARLELSRSPEEPGRFVPLRLELDTD